MLTEFRAGYSVRPTTPVKHSTITVAHEQEKLYVFKIEWGLHYQMGFRQSTNIGVKQRCILSHLLFVLYLDDNIRLVM